MDPLTDVCKTAVYKASVCEATVDSIDIDGAAVSLTTDVDLEGDVAAVNLTTEVELRMDVELG